MEQLLKLARRFEEIIKSAQDDIDNVINHEVENWALPREIYYKKSIHRTSDSNYYTINLTLIDTNGKLLSDPMAKEHKVDQIQDPATGLVKWLTSKFGSQFTFVVTVN